MIPGNASAALIPNQPNRDASALSLFLTHSFRPFSSLRGGSPPPDAVAANPRPLAPGNNASTSTPMAIPIAMSMKAIVIPCSLKRVLIFSAKEVSLEIVKCGLWCKLPLLPLLWHANAVDEN